jgi:hypothetical protein
VNQRVELFLKVHIEQLVGLMGKQEEGVKGVETGGKVNLRRLWQCC